MTVRRTVRRAVRRTVRRTVRRHTEDIKKDSIRIKIIKAGLI